MGAGAVTIPREILTLEQARSLGSGRLASLLDAPSSEDAARAALAIGRTRLPAGAPLLARHVDDARAAVRALSIYGLGVIALGTAPDAIVSHTADTSGAVRIAALDALQRYASAKVLDAPHANAAIAATTDRLLTDHDPLVRGRAAIALDAYGGAANDDAIVSALTQSLEQEPAAYVRERAMWTLFRGYAKRAPDALIDSALSSSDEVVRIEAVRALGKKYAATKNAGALALLSKRARDDMSWRVQEQALEAVRSVGGEAATTSWTSIPPGVRVPNARTDAFASLSAQPRPAVAASPSAPSAMDADLGNVVLPDSAQQMLSPAPGPHPRLRIVTTKGNMYVALFPEWAPLTVENFLNLSARGFYDDNRWFRIVPDFVVQTGEKDDKNAPGPGYTIGAEQNPMEQDAYVLSMGLNYDDKTNTPLYDSAGSEYYITLSPQYHLNDAFTVFGRVIAGFDVLGRLVESDRVVRIERIADVTL